MQPPLFYTLYICYYFSLNSTPVVIPFRAIALALASLLLTPKFTILDLSYVSESYFQLQARTHALLNKYTSKPVTCCQKTCLSFCSSYNQRCSHPLKLETSSSLICTRLSFHFPLISNSHPSYMRVS